MNKDQPLLNPSLKTDQVNSDSELTSNNHQKQEVSTDNESAKAQEIIDVDIEENYAWEKPLKFDQPNVEVENEETVNKKETDFIPVAYRVLGDKKPLLEIILTPWGIFSIVLFFIANAIIFVNLHHKSAEVATVTPNETTPEIDDNQKVINKQALSNQEAEKEKNKQSSEENIPSQSQNSQNMAEPPANSSDYSKYNPKPQIRVNKQSSPHPDLLTALQTNVSKTTKSPSPSSSSSNQQSPINTLQYYVISEYNGIDNFDQIQNSFPNALITNIENKIKIQLGVFDNEIDANKLIEQLKQKQITAYLYTPQPKPK